MSFAILFKKTEIKGKGVIPLFMLTAIQSLDFQILEMVKDTFHCGFFDLIMPFISRLGDSGFFWIVLAALLIMTKKYRRTGVMVAFSLLLGLIIGNMTLKPLIGRERPFNIDTTIALLIDEPLDASFPSGHTLASFEAATVLMVRERKIGIPALILAFLIAFSRLYLQVHFPSDVLFGMVLGTINGLIAIKAIDRFYERRVAKRDGSTLDNRRKK